MSIIKNILVRTAVGFGVACFALLSLLLIAVSPLFQRLKSCFAEAVQKMRKVY